MVVDGLCFMVVVPKFEAIISVVLFKPVNVAKLKYFLL